LIDCLSSTGKHFAQDVVEFYSVTGGVRDSEMDALGFTLWPLASVRTLNHRGEQSELDLAFGDVLLDACRYYFRFEDDLHSSVYGGYEFRKLAGSIEQFFELYLTNPVGLDLHSLEPRRPRLR
jgi:hypothetical protein